MPSHLPSHGSVSARVALNRVMSARIFLRSSAVGDSDYEVSESVGFGTAFALCLGAAPAWAADWGGIKDMGGGVAVPVPAPAPVPTLTPTSTGTSASMLGGNISQMRVDQQTRIPISGDSTPGYFAKDSGDLPYVTDLRFDVRPLSDAVSAGRSRDRLHAGLNDRRSFGLGPSNKQIGDDHKWRSANCDHQYQ